MNLSRIVMIYPAVKTSTIDYLTQFFFAAVKVFQLRIPLIKADGVT